MSSNETAAIAATWKNRDKRHFVMASALELLTEVGYQGLSMRGVAERCGMSLSNVQYYFRTKEDLITEIANLYFGDCDAVLRNHFERHGPVESHEALKDAVGIFTAHGFETTNMCRVFRELWAIGARDPKVGALLNEHYERLAKTLSEQLRYPSAAPEAVERMVALLLTISEGFSIVGPSATMTPDDAKTFFTDVLVEAGKRAARKAG